MIMIVIGWARSVRLQDRWTACRLGAEQLRIARMCLPLLVVPPAFNATPDKPLVRKSANSGKPLAAPVLAVVKRAAKHYLHSKNAPRSSHIDLTFCALTEAKRAVRDQGLPDVGPNLTPRCAVIWLKFIVGDQAKYHSNNHRKLELAEKNLHFFTAMIFVVAVLAVCRHFIERSIWLLLATAAAPAFAAALHGAGTRLGIVHRAALSEEVAVRLEGIRKQLDTLDTLIKTHRIDEEEAWRKVRGIAREAAHAMGRENTSWHGLVRRERDVLPS